jgi:hypothetical protein
MRTAVAFFLSLLLTALSLGASAALLLSVAFFGLWIGFIAPVNRVFATWTPETVPADWTSYRDRWELWHAVIAALKLGAFVSLAIAVLQRPSPAERPR